MIGPWEEFPVGPVTAQAPTNPNRWYIFIEGRTRTSQPRVFPPEVHVANGDPGSWAGGLGAWGIALPGDPSVTKLVVSHQNENLVYAATPNAIFKSADTAQTWREASTGLGENPEILELVIDPTNEAILYTATSDGIFVTHDEGASWTDITGDFVLKRDVIDLEISSDGRVLYAVLQGDGVIRRIGDGVWTRVATGIGTKVVNDVEIDPSDDAVVYLATDVGVWKSTTRGETWNPVSVGLPFSKVVDLAFAPGRSTIYALAQSPTSDLPAQSGIWNIGTSIFVGTPSEQIGEIDALSLHSR